MKKLCLILLATALGLSRWAAADCTSQPWTFATAYVTTTCGNVGVGTTSPEQSLTVSGYTPGTHGQVLQVVGTAASGTVQNEMNITAAANSWGLIVGANNGGVTASAYHC